MINNIRTVRESLGMSIEDVASKTSVGMKPRDVEKYENATTFVPSFVARILATAMGVDATDLIDYGFEE